METASLRTFLQATPLRANAALGERDASADQGRIQQRCRSERTELRHSWVVIAGCRVHAWASPEAAVAPGPTVLLLHGFGVSSSYWIPTAERLASRFVVYAPDLPGHGRSDTPEQPLGIPQLADVLVRWMDAVGLRRAALIGNSMGAQIAVDVAVRYPDRVESLALIGPTADPEARSVVLLSWRLLLSGPYERPSLLGILAVDYLRMGLRLIPEFRSMLNDRIELKLPQLAVPVLLVRGGKDAVAPQKWIEQAARLVGSHRSGASPSWANRIAVIPDAGHAVNYSAPQALTELIVPFLQVGQTPPR